MKIDELIEKYKIKPHETEFSRTEFNPQEYFNELEKFPLSKDE